MLVDERRRLLLDRLAREGKIIAKEMALELGLSEDSVRRDLRDMAASGLCQRVYGGALPASPALADYAGRATVEPASKNRIAAIAAGLITSGSTIILDGGTTTLAVARALRPNLSCTVITHSPTIAAALVDHPGADVFLIGGRLFKHSAVTCGSAATEAANAVSADLFLLGVTGVHPDHGLTTGDADEAAMKRALAARAAETLVLASAEKIGAASRYLVLPVDHVDGIVTDVPPDDRTLTELRRRGIAIFGDVEWNPRRAGLEER